MHRKRFVALKIADWRGIWRAATCVAAGLLFFGHANAIDSTRYQVPIQAIIDMIDAPLIPQTVLSPSRDWLMFLERPSLPSIAELAQPEIRVAGLRINPRNSEQSRRGQTTGIRLVRIADRVEKTVTGLPQGARIGDARSTLDDGIISHANALALALGAAPGMRCNRLIDHLTRKLP